MTDIFTPQSRYYGLAIRTHIAADGSSQTFVSRRIIPALSRYHPLDRHRTDAADRIDNLAAEAFGDPELYWRICDANGDADPGTATMPQGRLLVIPLPLEVADNGES